MKRKLLFTICILTFYFGQGQYVTIDSAFEDELITQGIDSEGVSDGRILLSDALSTISLNLSGSIPLVNNPPGVGLLNINGIEFFANLETLRIEGNSITNLDLSLNTNLRVLRAWRNGLQTLNVEGLVNLETVGLNFNNLSNVDFSSNIAAQELDITDNNLTFISMGNKANLGKFTLSNNPNLAVLNISGVDGSLVTFDTRGNTNLLCIEVSSIANANNQGGWLKEAGTSYTENCSGQSYTFIPDTTFENYLIAQGIDSQGIANGRVLTSDIQNVITLDMQNLGISSLSGIEDFVALRTLDVSDNTISTVDFSANTVLTSLNVQNNLLSAININQNINLTTLNIGGNSNLNTIDLSQNTQLSVFSGFQCSIQTLDLSANANLEELYISDNQITNIDLSQNTNLTRINVSDNALEQLDLSNLPINQIYAVYTCNTGLSCIIVSDVTAANNSRVDCPPLPNEFTGFIVDSTTEFSTDCGAPEILKINAYIVDAGQEPNYSVIEGNSFAIRFEAFSEAFSNRNLEVDHVISGLATESDFEISGFDPWEITFDFDGELFDNIRFNILKDADVNESENISITLPKPTDNYEWENANADGSLTFEITIENIPVIPISASINSAGNFPNYSVEEGEQFTLEFNVTDSTLENDFVTFKMETIGSPEDFNIENYFEFGGIASFNITDTNDPDNIITFNTISDNALDEGDIIQINLKLFENYVWDSSETELDGSLNFEVTIEDAPLLDSEPFEIVLTPKIDGNEIGTASSIEINEGQVFSLDLKALTPATENYNYSVFYNISGSSALPDDDFILDENPKTFSVQNNAINDGTFSFLINTDIETEEDETLIININPDPSNIYSYDSSNLNEDGSVSFELNIKNVIPIVSNIITVEFDNSGGYEGLQDTFTIKLKDFQGDPWVNTTNESIFFPVTMALFGAEESDFALFNTNTLAETTITIEIEEGESEGNLVLNLNTDSDSERESYSVTIDNPASSLEFNIIEETIYAEIIDSEGFFSVTAIADPEGDLKLITGDNEFETNCCRAYTIEEGKQLNIQFKAEKGVPAGFTYDFNVSYGGDASEQDYQKIDLDDILNGTVKPNNPPFDNQFQLQFLLDTDNNEISDSGSTLRDYGESFFLNFSTNLDANYSIGDPENEGFSSSSFQIFIVDVVPVTIFSEPNEQIAKESPIKNARFTAELDAPNSTGGDIRVNYEIILNDGDAVPGEDYTIAGLDYNTGKGSITIPFQQQSGSITVVPINDDKFEPDEKVTIRILSGDSYGVKNVNNQAQITIKSEDLADYTATIKNGLDNQTRESDPTDFAEIIIELNTIPLVDLEVEFKISNLTDIANVVSGQDYLIYQEDKETIIPSEELKVIFKSTIDQSKSIFIKALEDGLEENNESLYIQLDSGVNYEPISSEDAEVILVSSTTDATNFDPRSITITSKNPRCPGTEQKGSIEMINASAFVFNVTVNGLNNLNYSSSKSLDKNDSDNFEQIFDNLSIGTYEVILNFDPDKNTSIPANIIAPSYTINITELEGLKVIDQGINLKAKTSNYIVSGSTNYEVTTNGELYRFNFEGTKNNYITVPLVDGFNSISISGDALCLGIINKEVLLNKTFVYPNPTANLATLFSSIIIENYELLIYDVKGLLVYREKRNNSTKNINFDISNLQKGMYLGKIISAMKNEIEFKIIKK